MNSTYQIYPCVLMAAWLGLVPVASAKSPRSCRPPFSATFRDGGVLVTENGRAVLVYQYREKDWNGRFRRANYVHPLYDLDGSVMTEDFPQDHRHHRGIFWAWHQVLVDGKPAGDAWSADRFTWDVKEICVTYYGSQSIDIEVKVLWKSSDILSKDGTPQAFVQESTRVRVHRSTELSRFIDFDILMKPLVPRVRIGGSDDDKGYGGFSARIRMDPNMEFVSRDGLLEPQRTAIQAGRWLDFRSSGQKGVAILAHRLNPQPQEAWILRRQSSMQNAAFPGRETVPLDPRNPLRLRYRVVIHRSQVDMEQILAGFDKN